MTPRAIPNILTVCRLLSAPLVVWLIAEQRMTTAFWLFVAAALTDAADGLLAQHLNARSEIGSILDPLADKALLVGVYVALGLQGHLPSWLVILVVFRDLLIIGGVIVYQLAIGKPRMAPLLVSKINTLAEILLIVAMLANLGFGVGDTVFVNIMTAIVGVTVLASGGAYIAVWWRAATLPASGSQ
ncbi:MAG: CDP-alcohol phosphatidyltransferase family protein [Alphaproteobacteria bacterium]|nr:CDP-alcohol phosphatidyltransferase family protein [Alphaproteobacteria bacterium]